MKWFICILLLLVACSSEAGTVKVRWLNPEYNSDSLNCLVPDSTSILYDFAGVDVYGVRFVDNDTLYFGRIPGSAGLPDSADFDIVDGTMGELLFKPVDINNNQCCTPWHYIFAIPLPPEVIGPAPGAGLVGEYYRGKTFSTLLATRVDSIIDFNWGLNAPMSGVPTDSFCVRWNGYLNIPTTGTYTIYVSSDDGFKWWIDGNLFDWWGPTFEQEITTGAKILTAGLHPIRLEYMELDGVATCHLKWQGPGITKQVIKSQYLSHD